MTLINVRVNLRYVICCSALISCNKVLINDKGYTRKLSCLLFKAEKALGEERQVPDLSQQAALQT